MSGPLHILDIHMDNFAINAKKYFFLPMPPYVHVDFMVPPPGGGLSVTDF
jgi:hypothetical protein